MPNPASPYRIPDPLALLAVRIAAKADRYEVAVFVRSRTAVVVSTAGAVYRNACRDPQRIEHLVGVYRAGADPHDIHQDLLAAGVRR